MGRYSGVGGGGEHAVDEVQNLLTKANNDLSFVLHRLQKDFNSIYPDTANPCMLVSRIKKIQDDLSSLKDQCRHLLAAKQELVDKARTTLVGNRNLLQRMQASAGLPQISDSCAAFSDLNQVVDEWTNQVRPKTGDAVHDSDAEDINQLFFSAIVPNT